MDVVAALGMVVLAAWLVVMAAFTAVCAVAGIYLIFDWNIVGLLPSMPRLCAVLAGLMLLALCGLSAVGTVYYAEFLRQLCRAYGRQRSNALATAWNRAGAACSAPASPAEKGMPSPSAVGFRGAGDPLCTVPRRLCDRIRRQRRFAGILACMGLVWIWSVGGTKSQFI